MPAAIWPTSRPVRCLTVTVSSSTGRKSGPRGLVTPISVSLFCRTDPDAPKHRGISIVLLPLDTEGVTVRPLKELVHPDFPDLSEVFLDDVIVPVSNLVGELKRRLEDGGRIVGS